jgi:enoyl-CoA hydratase/carnithine racemase
VASHARLERDGGLGVVVIDHPPLNLFDAEMVSDILAALDESWRTGRGERPSTAGS